MWDIEKVKSGANTIFQGCPKKKIKKLKSFKDKEECQLFDYVHDLVRAMPILRKEPTRFSLKSNEESEKVRKDGHKELSSPKFQMKKALRCFSMSVLFAAVDSEQMSLAYSDRSHLFFEERLYNECVRDIERALKCEPSDELKETLQQLRQRVEEFKENHNTLDYHGEIPSVPEPKNKRIECASKAIGFATNLQWGRHIEAKRDISIGEVLVVEEPYITCLYYDEVHMHCQECLEWCYDLIPCPNCNEAMYCGDVCLLKAFEEYHKYECLLFQHGLVIQRLSLRLALKAAINHDSFVGGVSISKVRMFRSNNYTEVLNMKSFIERKTPEELFHAAVEAIVYYHFLTNCTTILQEFGAADNEKHLKEILLRNTIMVDRNCIHIQKSQRKDSPPPSHLNVASAIYPFYSNFQHACFYNTAVVFYGSKLVMYALMNIKSGEHVSTTYGTNFFARHYTERNKLLEQYYYTCKCIACEKKWPTREYLRKGDSIPRKLEDDLIQFIIPHDEHDRSKGQKVLEEAYTFFNRLHFKSPPSNNYVLLIEYINIIIILLGNTIEDADPEPEAETKPEAETEAETEC